MSEIKKKVVVLTSRFPYPLEKGDKLRAYYQIKELSQHFDVHLIALSDQKVEQQSIAALNVYCSEIHILPLSKISILKNVAFHFLSAKSIQVGYFYNKKWIQKVNQLLHKIQPDHIYTQLVRCSEYSKNYHHCPKTLDYMDALSTGTIRRSEKENFFLKWIFSLEGKRLGMYERRIFDYFDFKTIISDQDKKLISHPEQSEIISIPNGIDQSFFEYPQKESPKYDVGFIGNMNYPPNIDAALYIHQNYLIKRPNVTCLIAGATPHQKILDLDKETSITVAGWVEDIREAYSDIKLFVAPMQIGTGMQNKLLEAMAMGLPCVTTQMANNAIGAEHMKTIYVVESVSELQNAIDWLLQNPKEAKAIGDKAQKWVHQKYSWKSATEPLVRIILSR